MFPRIARRSVMDPTTVFCPNTRCHARGQTGQGNIGIHSQKERRFICHACHKTFSARKGTVFYRLRTSAETVVIVVNLLAPGRPVQAIVAPFGFDERTVAAWWARSGRQGQAVHEYLVEQPRDLGQVQAAAVLMPSPARVDQRVGPRCLQLGSPGARGGSQPLSSTPSNVVRPLLLG